jgi:hemoglobin-like flavoprotein
MSNLTPPEIVRPDNDSARMVQESIARLAGREMELTEGFYNHLFAMLPEVRVLFPEDMAEQRVRLLKALLASVDSLHDPEGMEAQLQALGEIHYYWGIADDQYQYVGHALIRTVRDVVPGDWSTWLSSAWISVYSWMTQHMVLGAKRAREYAESGAPDASFHASYERYLGLHARMAGRPVVAAEQPVAHPTSEYGSPPGYPAQAYPSAYYAPVNNARAYGVREHQAFGSQGQDHRGEDPRGQDPWGQDPQRVASADTWVRYPQLTELGQEPNTPPAAVQPRPDQVVPSAEQPSKDQLTLAGTMPAAGNRSSWFGTPGAEPVATVFPRRRRGAGLR